MLPLTQYNTQILLVTRLTINLDSYISTDCKQCDNNYVIIIVIIDLGESIEDQAHNKKQKQCKTLCSRILLLLLS